MHTLLRQHSEYPLMVGKANTSQVKYLHTHTVNLCLYAVRFPLYDNTIEKKTIICTTINVTITNISSQLSLPRVFYSYSCTILHTHNWKNRYAIGNAERPFMKNKVGWLDALAEATQEYYYANNTGGGPSIKVSACLDSISKWASGTATLPTQVSPSKCRRGGNETCWVFYWGSHSCFHIPRPDASS